MMHIYFAPHMHTLLCGGGNYYAHLLGSTCRQLQLCSPCCGRDTFSMRLPFGESGVLKAGVVPQEVFEKCKKAFTQVLCVFVKHAQTPTRTHTHRSRLVSSSPPCCPTCVRVWVCVCVACAALVPYVNQPVGFAAWLDCMQRTSNEIISLVRTHLHVPGCVSLLVDSCSSALARSVQCICGNR
jgi:hypothetical protein